MMGRVLLLALAVGVSGCAALGLDGGAPAVDPRDQLVEGIAALEAGDHLRARGLLEPLYYQRWDERVGQEAMLVLIAAELDSRNEERRLWAAEDMSGRLLNIPGLPPWMVPVAESYYLLALELGAAEQRITRAEAARDVAEARATRAERTANVSSGRSLPANPRPTVPARIAAVENERNELRRQVDRLSQQMATRDRELAETKKELESIKRAIRPGGG